MFARIARWPVFARIGLVILLAAAIGGQIWQRQPAGRFGLATLAAAQAMCPSLSPPPDPPSIADVARILDRAAWRLILDRVSPAAASRCAEGKTQAEPKS